MHNLIAMDVRFCDTQEDASFSSSFRQAVVSQHYISQVVVV